MHSILEKNFSSNIGWFRLHEASIKNEHERAFLNYRLLMYSYNDEAYQKEIKAFLHCSFDEASDAIRLFQEAFYLYFENSNYLQCIVIYIQMKKLNAVIENEFTQIKNIIEQDKDRYILFLDIL